MPKLTAAEIENEVFNKHMVCLHQDGIAVMNPPRTPMSKADALAFAAWIVAIADDNDDFPAVLAAVQSA